MKRQAIKTGVHRLPAPVQAAVMSAIRATKGIAGRGQEAPGPLSAQFTAHLDESFATGSRDQIAVVLRELHELNAHAERLASPAGTPPGVLLSETSGIHSMQFMIDLLPFVQELLSGFPRGRTFTVLDVGPGTGMGTALLAQMYSGERLGYRMDVTALDIRNNYQNYIAVKAPRVRFVKDDVFTHEGRYDIVISSHVIEHLSDPVPFCQRLQELATVAVFIVAPYKEPEEGRTRGHISVIDEATVAALKPTSYRAVHSAGWGAFAQPPYEMLIAELPGLAEQ